jgi:hypothetical protein
MSSTSSNDSLSSTTSSDLSLSPHEMSLIILDNPSVDLLQPNLWGRLYRVRPPLPLLLHFSQHQTTRVRTRPTSRRTKETLRSHHGKRRLSTQSTTDNKHLPPTIPRQRIPSIHPTATYPTIAFSTTTPSLQTIIPFDDTQISFIQDLLIF